MTKNWDDGQVLTESQLDDIKNSVETFFNTTKLDSDNIQDGGIDSDAIAALAVTAAKLASSAVETAKINDAAVTVAKLASASKDFAAQFGAANYSIAASVATSALTIALNDAAGSDFSTASPLWLSFRSATAATGTPSIVSATSAITDLVVPNTGTLGHRSGGTHSIYVYAINNAGAIELAVSSILFDEGTRVSTTAITTGADSNSVMYSNSARTNVGCRLLGRLTSTQAAAGVWDTAISEISLLPFDKIKIAARYTKNDAQTVNNSSADVILYDDLEFDTHNLAPASGVFTMPRAGRYWVQAMATTDATTDTPIIYLALYKDGVEHTLLARGQKQGATSCPYQLFGGTLVQVTAGQTLSVVMNNTSGSTRTTATSSSSMWVSIHEI
jgi:hypothetical protein